MPMLLQELFYKLHETERGCLFDRLFSNFHFNGRFQLRRKSILSVSNNTGC